MASSDRIFDRLLPAGLVGLALLGSYHQQPSLVSFSLALLLTLLATRYWSRHCLDRVVYQRQTSDDRAFPGDEVLLTLRISNPKLLPLPWLEVEDRVPETLKPTPADGSVEERRTGDRVSLAGSLGWHERIGWSYRLRCSRRGIYPLGPASISSGDPFGFFPRSAEAGQSERLVVYPRLIPLEQLGLPPGSPLGERKADRWIFEDPSRLAGVRDYRPEDPFHRIHWKATARRQQLQVKVHEPSTTLETALFIGVETFPRDTETRRHGDAGRNEQDRQDRPDGQDGKSRNRTSCVSRSSCTSCLNPESPRPEFELAVSAVASLAHRLTGQRHPVGLYLNGGAEGICGSVEVAPAAGQEQLIRILETLAGVEAVACDPLEMMLDRVVPRLPWGASVMVAVGSLTESLLGSLQGMVEMGRRPVLLLAGDDPAPHGLRGVTIYRLRPQPMEN